MVPIGLKEEDFSVTCCSHKHCLRRRVGNLHNWGIVRFEHDIQLNHAFIDRNDSYDTRVVTDSSYSTPIYLRPSEQIDAVC